MVKPYLSYFFSLDTLLGFPYNTSNRVEDITKEVLRLSNQTDILSEFKENITKETYFGNTKGFNLDFRAQEIHDKALQLSEIAFSALVPRVYITRYQLTKTNEVFESVSSHTNLLMALVDQALTFQYGPDFTITNDGFTYREIMEAIRRHDLPENSFGDQPDNGERDDENLAKYENSYWRQFTKFSSPNRSIFESKVNSLLISMREQTTETGRLLHVADKAAAVFMALCCDEKQKIPTMSIDDPAASAAEQADMKLCENKVSSNGVLLCRASEMWTIDFFNRQFNKMDHTGFFTSLIMMKTIMLYGKWYNWRKDIYHD